MKTKLITVTGSKRLEFNDSGRYVVFFKNISGTIECVLNHESAEVYLFGLYDLSGKEAHTLHTKQLHAAPGAFSQLSIVCVADDTSSFRFSGLIRIEKKAQKSHAYQKNQNLILSPDAFVDSRPMLEIEADDVFCTHGSTTGTINAEHVRYMMSRGISKQNAEEAYVQGFIQQLYQQMSSLGATL